MMKSSFCQVIKWHERHSTEIRMWLKMEVRLNQEHNCFLCKYLRESDVKGEWLVDDMKIIMWRSRLDMRSINDGRESREIWKSRRLEELKAKFENLRRGDPSCIQLVICSFVLMPLAISARHPALKQKILSVKLGCFIASGWSLGGVSPVDVGVYWCSSCLCLWWWASLKCYQEWFPC